MSTENPPSPATETPVPAVQKKTTYDKLLAKLQEDVNEATAALTVATHARDGLVASMKRWKDAGLVDNEVEILLQAELRPVSIPAKSKGRPKGSKNKAKKAKKAPKPGSRKLAPEIIASIQARIKDGHTQKDIAAALKLDKKTVAKYSH